jgi:Fic family protein
MIFRVTTLPPQFEFVIARITKLREELRFATSDSLNRWTRLLARTTAARAMIGTNVMEGVNVTFDEAVAAVDGEEPLSEEIQDKLAILGYWRAMTYVVQLSKDPSYVHNEGTIKSLHYMMLSHDLKVNPGRWRPGGVYVTNIPTNKVVYEGPSIEMVPNLMAELIGYLNTKQEHALVRASMAHLNLTMIHPFSDGNGRMARALQTMVLSREGILDPQFSSIEEYIGRHSHEYYSVLAEVGQGRWNPQNDPLPWLRFSLTAHYRQAKNLLRRLTDLGNLWTELESTVSAKGLNERVIYALADAALGIKVRNPNYKNRVGISNQTAKSDLKVLAALALLVPEGEKRGRYYRAGEIVLALRERTKRKWVEEDPFETQGHETPELPGIA